jgi:Flp pilus assembly protein TadB
MRPTEITDDLRAIPDDLREVRDEADRALERAAAERPALSWALDVRVVLTAATVALVIAFVTRLAGLGFLLALLVFLLLFAGLWAGITRAAAPRRPTKPV